MNRVFPALACSDGATGSCPLVVLLALLLTGLAPGAARAQAPTWDWAVASGGAASAGAAVDAAGNSYETGYFSGCVTFGATTLVSAGGNDIYVVKRTATGSYEWAVRAGGRAEDLATTLAVDARGNVVVGGRFVSRSADFGALTVSNMGHYTDFLGNTQVTYDAFVARLAPTAPTGLPAALPDVSGPDALPKPRARSADGRAAAGRGRVGHGP